MRDAYSYSKSIRGKHRAAVSAGYDPCVSFTEMIGSVKDAVNRKITMEELIALAEARSEGNLARLMILNCSSRLLQENLHFFNIILHFDIVAGLGVTDSQE